MGPVRALAVGALGAAVAALLVAGCGHEDDGAPAATAPTGQRAECVVSDPQGEVIVQPGSITADSPVVLDDASLQDAVNLEVVERAVTPFAGRSTIQGVVQDYPPLAKAGLADSLADWDERQPLEGARLSADDGQQAVLVALRLADPGEPGHLDGVTVTLTEDGDAREVPMTQPLLVEPPDALCTVAEYDSTLEWAPQDGDVP